MTATKVNTIISNPRGNRIHSPFAFELVSEVLFAKDDNRFTLGSLTGSNDLPERKIGAIMRVAAFAKYKRILLAGFDGDKWMQVISGCLPDIEAEFQSGTDIALIRKNEMVVWFDTPPETVIQQGAVDSVWIFFDLEHNGTLLCFEALINDSRVSQTFRMNTFGIAIFNARFQKEHFVIKGKRAY